MNHLSETTVIRNAQVYLHQVLIKAIDASIVPQYPNCHALQWHISQSNCEKKGACITSTRQALKYCFNRKSPSVVPPLLLLLLSGH